MSRRWAYPALLAIPFLVGIAVLKGLTVEIDTFHGSDARVYQLPTIRHFADGLGFHAYPAAQTPLYHVLFAGYGKLVGFELWKLRLLNVVLSYLAVLALYRFLARGIGLERAQAFALALLFELSPYVFGASFTLLTDNLAILLGLLALDRFHRFTDDQSLATFALGCVAMAAAVLTRQSFLWLVLVAAWAAARGPRATLAPAAAFAAAALAPFAALVIDWGGLVPPGADPASCGLCTDRPGVGRDSLTLRTVAFTVALLGVYALPVYGPRLLRRWRELRRAPRQLRRLAAALAPSRPARRDLAIPLVVGVALLAVSPLVYRPVVPGSAGDAGFLWKLADRTPAVLGSELLFWGLVPFGALALWLLVRRAGLRSLPAAYVASFLFAALPVRLVYQKYFDPFALLALAFLASPRDLERPWDYGGIAATCAAFVAYAVSFAG